MRAALLYPLRLLQPRPPRLSFNHPLPRTTAHPFTWMNIDRHPTWNSPPARREASSPRATKAATLHVVARGGLHNSQGKSNRAQREVSKETRGKRRRVRAGEQLY
ncbi:unnamed protein product [Xylocopa violacea]|uniref:Uncharacterized protein n=1 Tax=Xylocopa violacea TaxID=135666 RepID=A0ABP1NGB7_XYLVO